MKITRFEDIESWKLARKLTNALYSMTNKSSFSADYALKDQIRRAAGSVMHNIAEGFDAGSRGEFARFLRYAQRSCTEVQSQLYLAVDQNYLTESEFCVLHTQAAQTRKKIGGFIRYLTEDVKATRPELIPGTRHQEPRTKHRAPSTTNQAHRKEIL